jgi:hypothetical protein
VTTRLNAARLAESIKPPYGNAKTYSKLIMLVKLLYLKYLK